MCRAGTFGKAMGLSPAVTVVNNSKDMFTQLQSSCGHFFQVVISGRNVRKTSAGLLTAGAPS